MYVAVGLAVNTAVVGLDLKFLKDNLFKIKYLH